MTEVTMGLTTAFVKQAEQQHEGRYQYHHTDYIDSETAVVVTCPVHGNFTVSPQRHLKGAGCPHCDPEPQFNTTTFIHRANQIHANRYTYYQCEYMDAKTRVHVKCRVHGYFNILPLDHLRGKGCPNCLK